MVIWGSESGWCKELDAGGGVHDVQENSFYVENTSGERLPLNVHVVTVCDHIVTACDAAGSMHNKS
jgi:hypothetical protein